MIKYPDFIGPAKDLESVDFTRIGHSIGVGEDEIHAFADVEAAGKPFDGFKRPKMLFEPHKFYAFTSGETRQKAVGRGLAYPNWMPGHYPKDSYPVLEAAFALAPEAALRACSWGAGQILGDNHRMIGFTTVYDMVNAFCEDADAHIKGMADFIVAAGIDDELRRIAFLDRPTTPNDCIPIVAVYNGPGFRSNDYHTKLASRHNFWRGIPDTPFDETEAGFQIMAVGSVGTKVKAAQESLLKLGHDPKGADGKFGGNTRTAVMGFQSKAVMPVTGVIDLATYQAIVKAVNPMMTCGPMS
ncbi:hypothetical protein LOKG_00044 [Loktanella phage pCB2051-A]|uniref:Peptidoglycan binding-like domain-containing protein n=1 Tax=Loktanella phage pCB2051-A TaxID=754044 RepID=M4QPB8_9CAUD|nr:endolysin [Loktanella phage pCB2051-A]AGH31480.1 hypothetical protein LOKG_00044 [Loktanella phage pCB2051-A]